MINLSRSAVGTGLAIAFALAWVTGVRAQDPADLPSFDPFSEPYRTPLSGDGFRFELFGEPREVAPRNRRSLKAWDLGVAVGSPGVDEGEALPFVSLYFWEHPNEDELFRGVVVGLYNELLYARSPRGLGPFEFLLTLENLNIPVAQGEVVDGVRVDDEELLWGWVRPGGGFGYRKPIAPFEQDNMLSISATLEPGYCYFDDGSETADDYRVPQDTFDLRAHLKVRADALRRNLLELPHQGWAFGVDGVHGHRTNWERWGVNGAEDAREERDYSFVAGYAASATRVPFVESERHRLVTVINGGVGGDLDRFSSQRVGGGPHAVGEEYDSTFRPVHPGAAVDEFHPHHYATLIAEYRWEPIFFTYVSARGAVGYLDRDRLRGGGRVTREDGFFSALGARLTTGFAFETRLQLDYNYNFGVVRRDGYGAHEIVLHVSGEL